MNLFLPAHQEVLTSLFTHQVDYIIIGGYAVIYHGYRRTTGDVDIWLKPDNDNKKKFIKALAPYGIEDVALNSIAHLDFRSHLMFSIGEEPEKVEFLTYISGVSFDDADREKLIVEIDNVLIPILHYHHLILSKLNTGRLKDLADVDVLQKIQEYKR